MRDCNWIRQKLERQSDGELPDRQRDEVRRHIAGCPVCGEHRRRLAIENRLLSEVHRLSGEEKIDVQRLAIRLNARLDLLEQERENGLRARVLPWVIWAVGFSILFLVLNFGGFEGGGVIEQVAKDLCSPHRLPGLFASLMSGVAVCAVCCWLIGRAAFRLALK